MAEADARKLVREVMERRENLEHERREQVAHDARAQAARTVPRPGQISMPSTRASPT